MDTEILTFSTENITPQLINQLKRIDNAVFEEYSSRTLGYIMPTIAICATKDSSDLTQIFGKININLKTNHYLDKSVTRAQLSNLAILPYMQQKGFGSKLVKTALSECKKQKCYYAYLNINNEQKNCKKLIKFYLKNGFILPQNQALQTMQLK